MVAVTVGVDVGSGVVVEGSVVRLGSSGVVATGVGVMRDRSHSLSSRALRCWSE